MPKEIGLNLNFSSNIKAKVQEIEGELKKIADKKLATATEKSVTRTQFAAMNDAMKMYGPGGKSTFSGYKPKGFTGDNRSSSIDWIGGKKSMYEIDEMMPQKKGGGGLMGALGLGAVAGGAAGGVMILAKVMGQQVKQSQIMNKFLGTLSKLFGMLIDLVLLPFIPLLVMVLLGLTTAILNFSKLWQPGGGLGMPEVPGKDATAIDWAKYIAQLDGFIIKMVQMITNPFALIGSTIANMLVAGLIGPWETVKVRLAVDWNNLSVAFNKTLMQWIETVVRWGEKAGLLITALWAKWDEVLWTIRTALDGFFAGVKIAWDNFLKMWTFENLIAGFKGFINAIIGIINGALAGMRGIPLLGGFVPNNIPFLAEGGTIAQTGMAVVHKGETVVPAGQSGGNTFNFPNYVGSKSDLMKMINDAQRQNGSRYNL